MCLVNICIFVSLFLEKARYIQSYFSLMYLREITHFNCSGYLNFLFAMFNCMNYLHLKLIMGHDEVKKRKVICSKGVSHSIFHVSHLKNSYPKSQVRSMGWPEEVVKDALRDQARSGEVVENRETGQLRCSEAEAACRAKKQEFKTMQKRSGA